ncbi:LPXTG cell wall anchor domain-containing protein [Micromonospora sp. DT233]|uniref:LPXTG cell wall anchor domain-containing protein n=1 Tax=Micromonospora sp. DT233 TaxID=3393432 RepID=UPI003CE7C9D5
MLKHSASRWLAGIGVIAAFAATATPALAAPASKIEVQLQDVSLAPGSDGVSLNVKLRADRPAQLRNLQVRYDYRALAGKVTIKTATSVACSVPEQDVLLCERASYSVGETFEDFYGTVQAAPTAKAKVGDSGEVQISVRADGGLTATTTSRFRISEGVDLVGGPGMTLPTVRPGGKFAVPLTVSNVGEKTVDGFFTVFTLRPALRAKEQFSNCRYVEEQPVWCQFDEKLPAGEGRTATLKLYVRDDTAVPTTQWGHTHFMTTEDFENSERGAKARARAATVGDGPKLTLRAVSKETVRAGQTDAKPGNNYTSWSIKVNSENGVDLEAIGDTVQGKAGTVVTATVGFRNNGPATLDRVNGDNEAATYVDVELPPGTAVVEKPDNCGLRRGTRKYLCGSGMLLVAGETYPMEFRLRIEKVIPNAKGLVRVNAECECPSGGGFHDDYKPANDKTWLVANPVDGGQGGGGSLPITGTPTGLVAGIGGLLLVAGLGGYLLARRRRTHFVA